MSEIFTMGEPMVVFIAEEKGSLKDVEKFTKALAGAELNVAIGLSRLNQKVSYITKLGIDPFGEYIYEYLKKENIGIEYVTRDKELLTGFYLKSKNEEGDPDIYYYRKNSAASSIREEDIENIDFNKGKLLHVTGISLALSSHCLKAQQKLIDKARKSKMIISFDPNIRKQLWKDEKNMIKTLNEIAFQSDYFFPGIAEGRLLTGLKTPQEIANFYLNHGVELVVVKLGEEGAYVKTKEEEHFVEGFKVSKVVDTVGAGDGFATGVISGILEGLSIKDAVKRGNAIGAIVVMSKGDNSGLPSKEMLEKFLHEKMK